MSNIDTKLFAFFFLLCSSIYAFGYSLFGFFATLYQTLSTEYFGGLFILVSPFVFGTLLFYIFISAFLSLYFWKKLKINLKIYNESRKNQSKLKDVKSNHAKLFSVKKVLMYFIIFVILSVLVSLNN